MEPEAPPEQLLLLIQAQSKRLETICLESTRRALVGVAVLFQDRSHLPILEVQKAAKVDMVVPPR